MSIDPLPESIRGFTLHDGFSYGEPKIVDNLPADLVPFGLPFYWKKSAAGTALITLVPREIPFPQPNAWTTGPPEALIPANPDCIDVKRGPIPELGDLDSGTAKGEIAYLYETNLRNMDDYEAARDAEMVQRDQATCDTILTGDGDVTQAIWEKCKRLRRDLHGEPNDLVDREGNLWRRRNNDTIYDSVDDLSDSESMRIKRETIAHDHYQLVQVLKGAQPLHTLQSKLMRSKCSKGPIVFPHPAIKTFTIDNTDYARRSNGTWVRIYPGVRLGYYQVQRFDGTLHPCTMAELECDTVTANRTATTDAHSSKGQTKSASASAPTVSPLSVSESQSKHAGAGPGTMRRDTTWSRPSIQSMRTWAGPDSTIELSREITAQLPPCPTVWRPGNRPPKSNVDTDDDLESDGESSPSPVPALKPLRKSVRGRAAKMKTGATGEKVAKTKASGRGTDVSSTAQTASANPSQQQNHGGAGRNKVAKSARSQERFETTSTKQASVSTAIASKATGTITSSKGIGAKRSTKATVERTQGSKNSQLERRMRNGRKRKLGADEEIRSGEENAHPEDDNDDEAEKAKSEDEEENEVEVVEKNKRQAKKRKIARGRV
ncbi:MAG: hypothetical protein M1817_006662 [Caeruleum heppii]|nr:MAG: hypothetical protein M1817_006662 [Caeruleum heppii]